jgi:hypothetical protein
VPCGARHGHGDEAGIVRSEEQFKFPPLSRNCYQSSGHALQICHRTVACRPGKGQRGLDRALPPGPSRSARPPFPVGGRRDSQRCPQMSPPACPPGTNWMICTQ